MLKKHYTISTTIKKMALPVYRIENFFLKPLTKVPPSSIKNVVQGQRHFSFITRRKNSGKTWEQAMSAAETISCDLKPQKLVIAWSSVQGLSGTPTEHKNTKKPRCLKMWCISDNIHQITFLQNRPCSPQMWSSSFWSSSTPFCFSSHPAHQSARTS